MSKRNAFGDERRAINTIRIGQRHRRDMGDIGGLAKSISELGLLHPIVINRDSTLIAGERRLEACKKLGWKDVRVTVVDMDEIVRGELAENAIRKDFLPSEIDAIRRAIEPLERAAAKERMTLGKISPGSDAGRTRDKIGAIAGISGRTVEKIAAIVEAAEAEPEKYGELLEAMDRTGAVSGIYRRIKIMRQAAEIRKEAPPLPGNGPYRVIVADPPWKYEVGDHDSTMRGIGPYPRMTLDEITAFPAASIAADDCVLWLWTTNAHMRDAFTVLDAWGFQQKSILTWAKDKMGKG
jgi:hypothetical protein